MQSDIWIMRMVAGTLCLCAVALVGVVGYASLGEFEVDQVLDRLSFLLLGGLLTAFTTKVTGKDPLQVENPPGEVLDVTTQDGPLD